MSSPPTRGQLRKPFPPPFSTSITSAWSPSPSASTSDQTIITSTDTDTDTVEKPQDPEQSHDKNNAFPLTSDLPSFYITSDYWSHTSLDPAASPSDTAAFLAADFSVSRLEAIFSLLWWAGRQVPARPIHRQRSLGRTLSVTEQADLHLVWHPDGVVFLKPVPDYLLDGRFWEEGFVSMQQPCSSSLYASLAGFLLSWCWLVRYPSDFRIAQELGFLPAAITWPQWKLLSHQVLDSTTTTTLISNRYRYGELRLNRLDQIYRLAPRFKGRYLVRGYLYSYRSYAGFFKRKFAWLLGAFAYVSILLGAMQLGLATQQLQVDEGFNRASYGFAVLAIVVPVFVAVVAVVLYVALFLYHLLTTLAVVRHRKKQRKKKRAGPSSVHV